MINFSQKGEYFCMIMKFFLNFLLFLLLKVSDPVFKQNPKPVDNLREPFNFSTL